MDYILLNLDIPLLSSLPLYSFVYIHSALFPCFSFFFLTFQANDTGPCVERQTFMCLFLFFNACLHYTNELRRLMRTAEDLLREKGRKRKCDTKEGKKKVKRLLKIGKGRNTNSRWSLSKHYDTLMSTLKRGYKWAEAFSQLTPRSFFFSLV